MSTYVIDFRFSSVYDHDKWHNYDSYLPDVFYRYASAFKLTNFIGTQVLSN